MDGGVMNEKANILLVDDKPARLLTYEAILCGLGHNLIRAQSGKEALAKVREDDIAVSLLDVSMPGRDGVETAAMIREHPRSAHVPIIFVTGVHLSDFDRLRGYEIGAADYVSVPVVPEVLRGKVNVLVELYLQRRELARLNEAMAAANAELAAAHAELHAENRRELQELNGNLEFANMQLTAEIAERKRAEALLREAAQRKDQFLAILAHELRNPLSAIHNGVRLMQTPVVDEERLGWIHGLLERQLKHLTRLIDDLLDVARITSGRVRLQREPLDLQSVIRQSVESVRALIDSHRHSLEVRLPTEPLYLDGDLVRLAQVFGNLLTNAAKYTKDAGKIEIELATEDDDPLPCAVVTVRDSGDGIPPDMLERVFELFAQATPAEARPRGGLGIGLSLVRGLVELHGGSVHARSDGVGHGSEFVVRLPLRTAAPSLCGVVGGGELTELPPLKLLIVDDNVDTAVGLATFLREKWRHNVRVAHTGQAGIRAALEFEPQVMLLDIGLPDLDGCDVARRLRGEERFAATPLIALTGYGGDADRERAAHAGFDAYLVKPVSSELLGATLRDQLAAAQPAAPQRRKVAATGAENDELHKFATPD
jgi:signal transduction histidine kinase